MFAGFESRRCFMLFLKFIRDYVDVLLNSDVHLFILVGPPGIGKSSEVLKHIQEMGLVENVHFAYETGYLTPLAVFRSLARIRMLEGPKLIIYDDVDSILKNKVSVGILKGALADVRGVRTVSYQSTTSKEKDQSFIFDGKCILILNDIAKNDAIKPFLDRGIFYNVELKKGELEEYIEHHLPIMYPNLNNEDRLDVWNKIKVFIELENFSFRTVKRAFAMFKNNKKEWLNMFKQSLIKKLKW